MTRDAIAMTAVFLATAVVVLLSVAVSLVLPILGIVWLWRHL